MYKYLTDDHTVSLISIDEVESFKRVAAKHRYISNLIGNREFDLFIWRLALDVFNLIDKENTEFLFLPDRSMISPLQYFLLNKFVKSHDYKRLSYTTSKTEHERYLISVYVALNMKRWAMKTLEEEQRHLQKIFSYGDLFSFIHESQMEVEELPLDVLKTQAEIMKKLKMHMVENDSFSQQIKQAIIEAKNLSDFLNMPVEECVKWKITQLK